MRSSVEFAEVIRSGRRARRDTMTVYLRRADSVSDRSGHAPVAGVAPEAFSSMELSSRPPRVGLVVSKSVGNSVVRHRVSRQLRAQLASRVVALPPGSSLVVRAHPLAAQADSRRLGLELDAALARLLSDGKSVKKTKDENAT